MVRFGVILRQKVRRRVCLAVFQNQCILTASRQMRHLERPGLPIAQGVADLPDAWRQRICAAPEMDLLLAGPRPCWSIGGRD
jgi:hypothetical protein